jgi:hypothetical protein
MNDQDRDELVDDIMRAMKSTITSCVSQAFREFSVAAVPKECTVSLWASETAAYIGRDSWMSRDKALAAVWKRTNEAHFATVQGVWRAYGGCLPDDSTSSEEVRRRLARVFDPFPNVVTVQDVEEFRRTSKTSDVLKLYKAKGQVFEETLATEFSKTMFQPVLLRNTSVVWSSTTRVAVPKPAARARSDEEVITDPGPFQIVGQVDGWLCEPPCENTIVEFKLRCTRIPNEIPFRDFAQVQTYLHVHDTKEAMYVQGLLGSREMRSQTIVRDDKAWQEAIFPGLQMFVCDVRRLLRGARQDVSLQSRVLSTLNEEPHKAAPIVRLPTPRASSAGPFVRKNTSAQPALKPEKVQKKKTSGPTERSVVAFLPPEYKPHSKPTPKPHAAVGYNTRSKKRQKQDSV